jgi:hypothetical protein
LFPFSSFDEAMSTIFASESMIPNSIVSIVFKIKRPAFWTFFLSYYSRWLNHSALKVQRLKMDWKSYWNSSIIQEWCFHNQHLQGFCDVQDILVPFLR